MLMQRQELAAMILKTLNVFDFLQFVDEGYESGDATARKIVDRYFRKRHKMPPEEMPGVLPFAQLMTILSILTMTLCFAETISDEEWTNTGFLIVPEFSLEYSKKGQRDPAPHVSDVLKTIRNACAHLPEFADGINPANVSFDSGCVRFRSFPPKSKVCSSEVYFSTPDGFIEFLRGYLHTVRRLVRENLLAPVM